MTERLKPLTLKLRAKNQRGVWVWSDCTVTLEGDRMYFNAPFVLKDALKAMEGARWHGYEDPPRKQWSVLNNKRNQNRLAHMAGMPVFSRYDAEMIDLPEDFPTTGSGGLALYAHQLDLVRHFLTYRRCIWAAEMGTGKSASALKVAQYIKPEMFLWVGPKKTLPAMELEFEKWDYVGTKPNFVTYDKMKKLVADGYTPDFAVFDEASRIKGMQAERTKLAREMANRMADDSYLLLMSGTPAPKSPMEWLPLTDIACPGWLLEGNPKQLERRLGFTIDKEFDAGTFQTRIGWRDNENKCDKCGVVREEHGEVDGDHTWVPSVNEVAKLHKRLRPLVIVKHIKDCVDLPDKRYRRVYLKPSASTERVVDSILNSDVPAITALTQIREISDGFLYKEVASGTLIKCGKCGGSGKYTDFIIGDNDQPVETELDCNCEDGKVQKMVRNAVEVACPKDAQLALDLSRCEETGRIVIFAGFTASVDRIVKICRKEGWDVVCCDGRGWHSFGFATPSEKDSGRMCLEYWQNSNNKVAFVSHPESGGLGLTLVESRVAVFFSNTFKPEYRVQAEARVHRIGMDLNRGCEIVDYIHLPIDEKVLDTILDNRRIELMTLGQLRDYRREIELVTESVYS